MNTEHGKMTAIHTSMLFEKTLDGNLRLERKMQAACHKEIGSA